MKLKWIVTNTDGNHYTVESGPYRIEYSGPRGWVLTNEKYNKSCCSLPLAKRLAEQHNKGDQT